MKFRMLEIYCCLLVPLATLETYIKFSFLIFYMQIPVETSGPSVIEKTEGCDQVSAMSRKIKWLNFLFLNINNKCATEEKTANDRLVANL